MSSSRLPTGRSSGIVVLLPDSGFPDAANASHDMTAVQVIRLTAEHAAPYRDLMLHGYRYAPDAFTSTAEERAALPLAWWAQRAADPEGLSVAFGAMAGSALVGTVALEFSAKPKTRHKAHLIGMYVLAAWRGQGLGRELVGAALHEARCRPGVTLVTLTVTEGNLPAVALYEAFGFTAFGTEPMAMLSEGGYRAKVHLWKWVGQASTSPECGSGR